MVDPKLSVDDLSGLGSRLTLPQGWTLPARVLETDCELVVDGKVVVTQEDLANTYQRRSWGVDVVWMNRRRLETGRCDLAPLEGWLRKKKNPPQSGTL